MQVTQNLKGVVKIHLSGTPVTGRGNPHYGEGVISLSPYGAKVFAYELLLKATDAEWYAAHSRPEGDTQLMAEGKIPLPTEESEEDDAPPVVGKEELLKKIMPYVYPTTQMYSGEITAEEYVVNLAKSFANELFDRRMEVEALPLIAKLACILHNLKEIEY